MRIMETIISNIQIIHTDVKIIIIFHILIIINNNSKQMYTFKIQNPFYLENLPEEYIGVNVNVAPLIYRYQSNLYKRPN